MPRISSTPVRRVSLLAAGFFIAILSCGPDATGPGQPAQRYARGVSFNPVFPEALTQTTGASLVPFDRVRITLRHADGSIALDTVVLFPAATAELPLNLTVPLAFGAPESGELMEIRLAYVNADGDTVFRGGPTSVNVVPAIPGFQSAPVSIPVIYTGTGATATSVLISPRSATVFAGDPFSFTAVALDAAGNALPGTPIVWTSLDPTVAAIASPAGGAGMALGVRGSATIAAQLLTGQSDNVTVSVLLRASAIVAVSGTGQTTLINTLLPQPLVARVTASDGVGVAGVTVTFAVTAGGGSVGTTTATTDANGFAQTTWTLGSLGGAQTVHATAVGLTGSPVTYAATGTLPPATQLIITTQPVSSIAGAAIPVVVTARDQNNNVATSFNGAVTLAFSNNPSAATLNGTTTVNAVAGVATFSTINVTRTGTSYSLVASGSGVASATTTSFDISPAAVATIIAESGNGQFGVPGVALALPFVARVRDAFGNDVPGVSVAWLVTLGGGTLSALSPATDANGRVSRTLTLGVVAGPNAVTANVVGVAAVPAPAAFTATSAATVATKLAFVVQPPASVGASVAISPSVVVQAQDAAGNRVVSYTGNVTVSIVTNPGAAFLGGTPAVAAVAGNATFANLTLDSLGVGYKLGATASGLSAANSALFNVVAGVATTIAVDSGDGQTGAVSSPVANQLVARAVDAFGNPVSGVPVTWAIGTGGGSLFGTTSTTDANGRAHTGWNLGTLVGAQTVTATSAGLVNSPLTFTATASVPVRTWNGSTSSDWGTATNWSPAIVPTAADSVFIVAITNQPALGASFAVKAMVLGSGAIVNLGPHTLTVGTNLDASLGSITGGTLVLTATGNVRGTTSSLVQFTGGTHTLNGTFTAASASISAGVLDLNGFVLTIATSDFSTGGTGQLRMTAAGSGLTVPGNVTFGGGSTVGLLTAGDITVAGNFFQAGTNSYAPSGAHSMTLNGAALQTVLFADPVNSFFRRLFLQKASGSVVLGSDVRVNGVFRASTSTTSAPPFRLYADSVWGAVGSSVTPFVVEINRQMADSGTFSPDTTVFTDGANHSIQTSFAGFGTYAYKSLRIAKSVTTASFGVAGLTLANDLVISGGVLQINGAKVGVTGHFKTQGTGVLQMTNAGDSLGVGQDVLVIGGSTTGTLTNGVITIGGSFVQGGAADAFAANGSHRVRFDGAAAGVHLISFANPVSSSFRRLFLNTPPGAGQEVRLNSNVLVTDSMVVQNGTDLTSNATERLSVQGKFRWFGGANSPTVRPFVLEVSTLPPEMDSTFVGAPRFFPDTLVFLGTANYTLPFSNYVALRSVRVSTSGFVDMFGGNSNDTLAGDLHITSGKFRLTSISSTIVQKLRTTGTGSMEMSSGTPLLVVRDSAIFAGGSVNPSLTAGTLRVHGNFVQSGVGSASSFNADPPHTLEFAGTTPQTVVFATPGYTALLSHAGNLRFSNTVGVTFQSDVLTHVLIDATAGVQEKVFGAGFQLIAEGVNATNMLFDNTRVSIVDNQTVTTFNNMTFQNYPTNPDILTVARSTAIPAFNALTFPAAGFTGRFVVANDPNGATGGVLTVSLLTSSPGAPGIQCLRSGGAQLSWNGVNVVTC